MSRFIRALCLLGAALAGWAAIPHQALAQEPPLLVFAAASTTDAISEIGRLFRASTGLEVRNSFTSSSTLANQIAQGAPAQVYVSANVKWMDYLEKKGLLAQGTRRDLLRNQLVLVAPAGSSLDHVDLAPGSDLGSLLGDGRLAMGDPAHVPAGIYGRQALTSLGLWDQVRAKVAALSSVRAALALVELGEAPLGVVYSTDAMISRKVKIVGRFPERSHPPIVYPVALVAGQDTPMARQYLEFLHSPQALAVFRRFGFKPLP